MLHHRFCQRKAIILMEISVLELKIDTVTRAADVARNHQGARLRRAVSPDHSDEVNTRACVAERD